MTRHSTLTNPNDLHYAKARAFTGDPTLVQPDFIDQILFSTDTNKSYRSTGISTGNLIELGSGGSAVAARYGNAPPFNYFSPLFAGELFFDSSSNIFFVAVFNQDNLLVWRSTIPRIKVDQVVLGNPLVHSPEVLIQLSLLFANILPTALASFQPQETIDIDPYSDLSQIFEAYGAGVYIPSVSIVSDPDGENPSLNLNVEFTSSLTPSNINTFLVENVTFNGYTTRALYLSHSRRQGLDLNVFIQAI